MKTNENQKTNSHQPGTQKPFFGASHDHAFFSTPRAESTPFIQAKVDAPSAIQAKSATTDTEGISEEEVQRMAAFESEMSSNGEVQRKLINYQLNSSLLPIQAKLTIGEPGDKYEQEADRVASQVVEHINTPAPAQSTQGESVQRQEENKEELQAKPDITALQRQEESRNPNKTGLPDDLKAGVENLSGYSLHGVRVHYNSPKPAQLQALAYTQGTEIHVASGQEEHLPDEAWHVVQQAQGRVQPTMQMKDGVPVNDDAGLEQEADVMGAQALAPAAQLAGSPAEEELLQGKFALVQRADAETDRGPRENKTGLPDNLKTGIESLSGMSLDNVKVHYNSAQPVQYNALAYAQGSDIHIAPGQEQHLPHEAWHIVQQAQGRVQPTKQMKSGVPVNEDVGLEREADVMGAKALARRQDVMQCVVNTVVENKDQANSHSSLPLVAAVQRRAATADELGLVDSGSVSPLFNAHLTDGKLFTKEIAVTSHDAKTVIPSYINAIRPVGNVAAGFGHYTDRAMVSPAAQLGVGDYPPAAGGAFDLALANGMGMSPSGILFVRKKTKEQAVSWLTAAALHPQMNLNSDLFNWVDPFQVKFTFTSRLKGHRPWEITTQFADSGEGYVVKIVNGENDLTGTILTPDDFRNGAGEVARSKMDFVYSSTHEQGDEFLSNRVGRMGRFEQGNTKGSKAWGFDAITWLAAEGARFEPVRKMGMDAKPTTEFYIKPAGGGWAGARSVNLIWLVQNWGDRFRKAYNIPAATIAGEIAGVPGHPPPPGVNVITQHPVGARYNLTLDKIER